MSYGYNQGFGCYEVPFFPNFLKKGGFDVVHLASTEVHIIFY